MTKLLVEELKRKADHLEYIMKKSRKAQNSWKKFMNYTGSFSDFEKPMTIKTNSSSSKPADNTPDSNADKVNFPSQEVAKN